MPRKSRIRDRRLYDDTRATVAALHAINTAGQTIEVGSEIDHEITDSAFRRRLWASGRSEYADEFEPVPVEKSSSGDALSEEIEKDQLIDAIKELGGKATRSSKIETLRAKLDSLIDAESDGDPQDDEGDETAGQGDEDADAETADEDASTETDSTKPSPGSDLAENADEQFDEDNQ